MKKSYLVKLTLFAVVRQDVEPLQRNSLFRNGIYSQQQPIESDQLWDSARPFVYTRENGLTHQGLQNIEKLKKKPKMAGNTLPDADRQR